jgi:hypothetical protein
MSAIKFTLTDSDGASHDYNMTRHLGGEGSMLTGSVVDLMKQDIATLLDGVDASSLGPAIAEVMQDPKAHRLVRKDLMKYVTRDGKPLANDTNFDQAFQGNYSELFTLCWEVAKRNRFLPLGSTS